MLSNQTIEIVESTIPLLAEHGEEITRHFYDKLLTENPELKHVFNPSNQAQGGQAKALAGAVFAYANNLNNLPALLPAVERIANKHVSLGVKPEQYPIIGGALLSAIQNVADLPDEHPALIAWGEAYGLLADIFIKAEEHLYQENESAHGGWRGFREFVIDDIKQETYNVKSFNLKPKDGGDLPSYKGGQYVGTKVRIAGSDYDQIRQYSLSSRPDKNHLRITPKLDQKGSVSNYLHHAKLGTSVFVQAPTGVFNLDLQVKNHIFIAGGVGITPLMSMFYEALDSGVKPENILFIQAQSDAQSELFKQEFADLKRDADFHYQRQISGNTDAGRINEQRLKNWVKEAGIDLTENTAVYTCGPKPFMSAIKQYCVALNVPVDKIYLEVFGPTEPV